jgi:putative DNA primase/helicase
MASSFTPEFPSPQGFPARDAARVSTTLNLAERFESIGYSIIPIKRDGSKAPPFTWKQYQQARADQLQLHQWFGSNRPYGIGLIQGAVSGNSEVVDVDCGDLFDDFHTQALKAVPALADAPLIKTPRDGGGYQIVYRNVDPPPSNLILARRPESKQPGSYKTAIETRGKGGYILTIGSPPECHPAKRPYRLIGGSFSTIPTLTSEERSTFHAIALGFDQAPAVGQVRPPSESLKADTGDRPGDDFNRRASWQEILEPHGWHQLPGHGDVIHWRRSGKAYGTSATTNYAGTRLLYVFSSNASPLESCRAYTKFAAFAFLEHHGDFAAAARELRRWGFGR